VKAQKVLLPIMKDRFPAVAMKVLPDKGREECERLLMRFLSNVAWVEEKGFLIDGLGGSLPGVTRSVVMRSSKDCAVLYAGWQPTGRLASA
jgi:hypothetical protein